MPLVKFGTILWGHTKETPEGFVHTDKRVKRAIVVRANRFSGDYRLRWDDRDRAITYNGIELGNMIRNGIIEVDETEPVLTDARWLPLPSTRRNGRLTPIEDLLMSKSGTREFREDAEDLR